MEWKYWTDQIAGELSKWKVKTHVINDSKTPSGRIHIGALRGVFIHDAVFLSVKDAGLKAKILYGWDEMDALDTVPSYLDQNKFAKYVGFPLFKIPSPDDGFKNYAEFFASEIIKIMKDTNCSAKHYRMSEMYKRGKMNKEIKISLKNSEKIKEIIRRVSGSEKGTEWLPFQVICENCGKIATTIATSFDGKKVGYRCESPVKWAKGCGHRGRVSPFNGNGKLPWKVEWAARWPVLKVNFEGAGHDHYTKGGTRFVANALSEEVFGYRHPYDLPYEWFYIGGQKMSSSKGIGASAKDMASTMTPEILRFLMIKSRPQTAIDFDPNGQTVIRTFDEYDRFARVYFGKEKIEDKREFNNIKRALELAGKPKSPSQMPIKVFLEIVRIAPEKNRMNFVMKKLRKMGYKGFEKKGVEKRLKSVEALSKYLAVEEIEVSVDALIKPILRDIILLIKKNDDGEKLQKEIFELLQNNKIDTKEFFKTMYKILLKSETGPRLGPYIIERGKTEVIKKLEEVVK